MQAGGGGGGEEVSKLQCALGLLHSVGLLPKSRRGSSCLRGGTSGLAVSVLGLQPPSPPVPFLSQVGTNGIISTQDFPRETQYVDDDFPTDFPAIAPFLADIDTSHGRGRVLYRQDTSPAVLGLAARYVRTGFPRASFSPTHALVATWEQVGAYEEVRHGAAPSEEVSDCDREKGGCWLC